MVDFEKFQEEIKKYLKENEISIFPYQGRDFSKLLPEMEWYDVENWKDFFSIAKKETTLTEFIVPDEGITVYADYREKSSGVIKKLIDLGIQVNLKKLDVGDYLVSDELCIEYKTVPDFIDSLIDKRLFTQLKSMKK